MFSLLQRAAAVVLSAVSLVSSAILPAKDNHAVPAGQTRVMTFNIRYSEFLERSTLVPDLIRQYSPDSIGLQECTYEWSKTIKLALPEYGFVGVGRDTGGTGITCGEMNAILYRKDKYSLVSSGTFWLSDTPNRVSRGWDAKYKRIATWAVLCNKATGETYAHVNTHLDHVGWEAREKGLALVLEKVKSFSMPTVLTGDFNFHEEDALFALPSQAGLRYARTEAKSTMSGPTYHNYRPENYYYSTPMDHIWVNSGVRSVETYRIVTDKLHGSFVSDHYPVYADIVL